MYGGAPSEKRRDRMELVLHLWPAPAPQVFELIQANLHLLSLAQPLRNSYHTPSYMLFIRFLLLYRSGLLLGDIEAFRSFPRWYNVKDTWARQEIMP